MKNKTRALYSIIRAFKNSTKLSVGTSITRNGLSTNSIGACL